jgi:hypothetical protein
METICAWCVRDGTVPDVDGASHGICSMHADEMRRQIAVLPKLCTRYVAGEGRHVITRVCPLAPGVPCTPEWTAPPQERHTVPPLVCHPPYWHIWPRGFAFIGRGMARCQCGAEPA